MRTVKSLVSCLTISLLAISDHRAWPRTISTVRIVVPVPPGGANDFLARVLAEQIGRAQGLAFMIANRTGAGGMIGAEAVSRSAHSNGFQPRTCEKRIS
jgi:tripartite-type tricarboxylate transporter receptor subunit TctC